MVAGFVVFFIRPPGALGRVSWGTERGDGNTGGFFVNANFVQFNSSGKAHPMEDLLVQPGLVIPDHELSVSTSRSGGPGGQHVNTTATRVTLRWNVRTTQALDPARRDRLIARLGGRVTADGDVLVHVSSSRSQSQNRAEALERLAEIVRKALVERKKRKPTRPSRSSRERRLREKKQHSGRKAARRGPSSDEG